MFTHGTFDGKTLGAYYDEFGKVALLASDVGIFPHLNFWTCRGTIVFDIKCPSVGKFSEINSREKWQSAIAWLKDAIESESAHLCRRTGMEANHSKAEAFDLEHHHEECVKFHNERFPNTKYSLIADKPKGK